MTTTRERMLTRLAGMDLGRVFDLDGTGFIDPIVLSRSLKVWDAAVFTDENVDDFLQWSKLEREPFDKGNCPSTRIINIQDMVSFVKSHCPKLPRLRRRNNSRGSRVSGASEATGAAETFAAAPRSVPARGGRANSRSTSRPPVEAPAEKVEKEEAAPPQTQPVEIPPEIQPDEIRLEEAPPTAASAEPPVAAAADDADGASSQVSRPRSAIGTPSQILVQRLAGLNILRVLDVDGNGLIDREVLKSALNIFDPEIFTAEGVDQLIHAATRSAGVDDGTHIRILDLALYMGTPIFYPVTAPTIQEGDEEQDDKVPSVGDRQSKATSSSVPPLPLEEGLQIGEPIPLTAAEEMYWAALEAQSDGTSALNTARTEIESVAAEPDSVLVAISELRGGAAGCTIKSPELRGITLRQLTRLMTYIQEHCERESWYDLETGEALTPETVDLFCLREWVLKPATRERRCSFAELVAQRPSEQRPRWYVSHCAGSVVEFVKCLKEHAERHGFSEDVAYWVDAYASNPWQQETNGADVWEKALAVSQGTVQIIGSGPVAYLEVGSHSLLDVDTEPFYGLRFSS